MEKPGRSRRTSPGHGLLAACPWRAVLLLLLLGLAREVRPDEDLTVIVQAGPGPVPVNSPWVITLLVDYRKPEELKLELPPLTGSLVLERMRSGPRVMEGSGEEIWTQIECVFIPAREGRAELEYLRIKVPDREFVTGRLGVEVSGGPPVPGEYHPRLSWAEPLPLFRAGEKAELMLLLSGRDPLKPLNFPLPFHVELSPFLILESRTPDQAEQRTGAVLALTCIPLEKGTFSLPPPRLEYQGKTLAAPPLSFTVREAAASNAALSSGGAALSLTPDPAPDEGGPAPAFPQGKPPLLPFIRAPYISLVERAEAHWKEGAYARALALLREGERDLGSGPALAALRLDAEKALGLDFTYDEPWRPRFFLRIVSILLSFGLVTLCLSGILRRLRGRFPVPVSAGILVAGLLLGIGGAALTGRGLSWTGNKAVLSGGAAYRVPDYSSGVQAEFREGQPALIRGRTALWVYAETYDGLSGWVPSDRVIPY
jgi:hypothetical protein